MALENIYENFRNVLTMNLCSVLPSDKINDVLKAVDISMSNFELSRKKTALITTTAVPDVVKMYLASRAVSNLSIGTLNQYKYKLFNFFQTVQKSYLDITANDIRMYLYSFKAERGSSDCYMENIRCVIDTFFKWLVENEYLSHNPCAKVNKIKYTRYRRKPLSSYELEYLRLNTKDIREKALVDFFFSTGCRVSECAAVTMDDIDWANRSVLIRHGKGDKERIVYFNAESEVTLKEYLKSRDDSKQALFVSIKQPHNPISAHGIEAILRRVSKRINMEVYPHKLRHTFATVGLHGGIPLDKLQALLGHTDPKTTLIYAKQCQEDIKSVHERVYA